MRYRNKNYIGLETLPWIISPVIAITIWLTLTFSNKALYENVRDYPPHQNLIAEREALLADTPEFRTGDEALFNFSGDTVLVLSQPDSLAEFDEEVRVLHKTLQGNFETIDLPQNWLVKIPGDTLAAETVAPHSHNN